MLKLTVLAGTTRLKRQSIKAARFVEKIGRTFPDVEITFVDPMDLNLPNDGNNDDITDPRYTKITAESDGFFIVTPEYNHSFPGSLKRMLDSEYGNYKHKPVAIAGVSNGPWGGVRAVESLIHPLRKMGMTLIIPDVYFPMVQNIFDEEGNLVDQAYEERVMKSWRELIWMAKVMRYGRESVG